MRVRRYSLTSVKPFEQVIAAFEAEAAAFVAFGRFDMGALLSREGRTVKCVRFLIGEREDGTHLSYDLMADYLLPYENAVASKTARLSRSSSTKRLEGGVHFGGGLRTDRGPRDAGRFGRAPKFERGASRRTSRV